MLLDSGLTPLKARVVAVPQLLKLDDDKPRSSLAVNLSLRPCATVTSFGAAIFTAGTPGLVFLLLLLAAAAAVSGCFLVAVLSPDASTAASSAAVLWLVAYLPYALVAGPYAR